MEVKRMVWLAAGIGSILGGLVPQLWNAGMFSIGGMVCSAVGALLGIWLVFKIRQG